MLNIIGFPTRRSSDLREQRESGFGVIMATAKKLTGAARMMRKHVTAFRVLFRTIADRSVIPLLIVALRRSAPMLNRIGLRLSLSLREREQRESGFGVI